MISYETLTDHLIQRVPELRVPIESERRWWGREVPGAHVVFGDILAPYIISELHSASRPELVVRVFEFLEELARHKDQRVRDVVGQAIGEQLCEDGDAMAAAGKVIGLTTLRVIEEACSARHKGK